MSELDATNRAAIEKVTKAVKSLREAADELRDAPERRWFNILSEKQSELILLIKEMEKDLLTQ
ncbi:MAG: hypothetical protein JRJ03_16135 [Deltaproteobacteria bacterium]|nr:hypothetical protein [Deltaproteobacteria bacterium]